MGRAMAHIFAEEGARVAVTDINEAGAAAVRAEILALGGEADVWRLDVADADSIEAVTREVCSCFGRLDILINNAGIGEILPVTSDAFAQGWDRSISIMLTGAQRLIRAALPQLQSSDAGRILNIASTIAIGGGPNVAGYCAAKAGLIGLTRALAAELGRTRVTVNCLCPGSIETPMVEQLPVEARAKYARSRIPAGRYGRPEEVAHMALSICLPAASYLNGAIIPVDGGLLCQAG
jgi:3-oxoacyl-[acyl-carrier protein] reductase